jgi:hypothetical protein
MDMGPLLALHPQWALVGDFPWLENPKIEIVHEIIILKLLMRSI